jgi:RNA polymerase sigma factor (sigma-70 family)
VAVYRQDEKGSWFGSVSSELRSLARIYGAPASECEDCAQEAILSLLKSHPDWAPDCPRALAWLRGATRNQALNYHRLQHRHPTRNIDDRLPTPDRGLSPSAEAEPRPDGQRGSGMAGLQIAWMALSELNRELISRHVQPDLTFAQIADIVGLKATQVKARYRRAVGMYHDYDLDRLSKLSVRRGKSRATPRPGGTAVWTTIASIHGRASGIVGIGRVRRRGFARAQREMP